MKPLADRIRDVAKSANVNSFAEVELRAIASEIEEKAEHMRIDRQQFDWIPSKLWDNVADSLAKRKE